MEHYYITCVHYSLLLILLIVNNYIAIDVDIGFSSSVYTVSEDHGFAELPIVKTVVNDFASTVENITILFHTSDGTAQG